MIRPILLTLAFSALSPASAFAADYAIIINREKSLGAVSRELMGFNVIYCFETDDRWERGTGTVPTQLAALNTGILRYPAGTVVTYYHWQNPTGQGWADSWNPKFDPSRNLPDAQTMSLDECLDVVKARGLRPLIGVNMGSGKRYPEKHQAALDEAVALVAHCVQRGFTGAYYYLDNEPYRPDANYPFQPEEYGDEINLYVPLLKAKDPTLKIVANLHSGPNANGYDYTRRAVRRAGANIDFVDLHFYWRHNATSFAAWVEEPRMLHQHTKPYRDQRKIYQQLFAEAGFPKIEPVALEWNISANGSQPAPTPAQAALMVSEQFIQFIQSGMKFATFWPLQFPKQTTAEYRAVFDQKRDSVPHKLYDMFKQFAAIGGQDQLESAVSAQNEPERLTHLALRSADGKTVTLFLVNKNQQPTPVSAEISFESGSSFANASALGFESTDETTGPLAIHPLTVNGSNGKFTIALPRNSFARIIFEENPKKP